LLIAVGFALLSTSAMLARSVEALITAPLGFEANSLVFAETQPARGGTWRLDQGESFARAFLDLRRRAAVLPGVASASLATLVPFSGWSMALPVAAGGRSMSRPPALSMIGPNFFRTMGIRILLGRPPTPEEVRLGQPKAVVSQGLARVIAPDGSAIGKNLRVLGRQLEIVGVCADVEYRSIAGEAGPHLYIPFTLFSDLAANSPQALVLVVRAASGTSQVELDLRKRRFSPGISLTDVRSARSRVDDTVSEQMVLARAFGFLAALAFALLILAVYGFARSLLAVRRLQVAVRLALGCSLARARWSLAQALAVPLLAGVLAGLVLSWLSGRVMQAWIYRSGPASPLILALAFAAVLLAVWLALLGPWRTIVSMDLSTVLHQN
ncbi:MAG: ABC transporter permease, partial [Terriglobales bacterium]